MENNIEEEITDESDASASLDETVEDDESSDVTDSPSGQESEDDTCYFPIPPHEPDSDMHKAIKSKDITKIVTLFENGDGFCYDENEHLGCFNEAYNTQDWSLVEKLFELQPSAAKTDGPYLLFQNILYPERVQYLIDIGSVSKNPCKFNYFELALLECCDSDAPSSTLQILVNQRIDVNTTLLTIGYTPLMKLCSSKEKTAESVKKVQILIKAKARVSVYNEERESLLLLLLTSQFNEFSLLIMTELISAGTNVNLKDWKKESALLCATQIEDPDLALLAVQKLLDAGAEDAGASLRYAATIWCPYVAYEIMRSLIAAGADTYKNSEALTLVCRRHEDLAVEMVTLFSNANRTHLPQPILAIALNEPTKSNLDSRDNKGNSPLILATKIHHACDAFQVVQFLLEAGADPNSQNKSGNTALYFACGIACEIFGPLTVNILLKAGANPSIENKENVTPLIKAITMSCSETTFVVVRSLIKAGANVNVCNTYDKNTLLLSALKIKDPGMMLYLVKLLIRSGSNVSAANKNGETPLMLAVSRRRSKKVVEVTKLLLQAGSLVDQVDERGLTPLHYAAKCSSLATGPPIVEILLNAGEDPKKQCRHGNTPLHCAFDMHDSGDMRFVFETVNLLLKAGSDPCVVNSSGENVLFSLARSRHFDAIYFPQIFQTFVSLGADISAKNHRKETPLMKCVAQNPYSSNSDICVKQFLEAGAYPSDQDYEGVSTLMHAICPHDPEINAHKIVKLLIDAGADVNAVDHDGNTVHTRFSGRTSNTIYLELYKRAINPKNARIKNEHGVLLVFSLFDESRLQFAHNTSNLCEVVKTMIAAGVDFSVTYDYNHKTLLTVVIDESLSLKHHTLPILKELLNSTVFKPKILNDVLMSAITDIDNSELSFECVDAILNAGANPFLGEDKSNGYKMVQEACKKKNQHGPLLVKSLLNALRSTGNYVFQYSHMCLKIAIDGVKDPVVALENVESLLEAGANPLAVDQTNQVNALDFVICMSDYHDRHGIVQRLLQVVGDNIQEPSEMILREELLRRFLTSSRFPFVGFARFLKIIDNVKESCGIEDFESLRTAIQRVFYYGFPAHSDNHNTVSCVTVLLAMDLSGGPDDFFDYVTEEADEYMLRFMKDFISRGADPCQQLFTFDHEEMHQLSRQYHLPDALWTAAISGFKLCVVDLLVYWSAPPLALIAFLLPGDLREAPNYDAMEIIIGLLSLLKKYGPLPPGSHIFRKVLQVLHNVVSHHAIEEDDRFVLEIEQIRKMERVIPSLLDLSLLAVRGCFTGGVDLPDRIAKLDIPKCLIDRLSFSSFQ